MLMNLPGSKNIAQVHEVLEDKINYYVVMEKVDGMDLFEVLENKGTVQFPEAKAILNELLKAVQDLHARGCIHKDLKLENVMVDKLPCKKANAQRKYDSCPAVFGSRSPTVVKLIDFDTVEPFSITNRAKSVVGTDQYIAPEAYDGHYSPTSDIFSVGVIAYRLIAGRFPFTSSMFDDGPGQNYVGSPKMKAIQDRLEHYHIDFNEAPWAADEHAKDLVMWMLRTNQKDRPTAEQCLQHKFFEEARQTLDVPERRIVTM
jgi:serine/threonine protein kinase